MNYQPLTKKQVAALMKVLSSDSSRPVLTELAVCGDESDQTTLVATDGYKLAALPASDLEDIRGKSIRKSELTKWYKLASTRDFLGAEDLREMATEPSGKYPNWVPQVTSQVPEKVEEICLNAEFLDTMQRLAGRELKYKFHGKLGAAIASQDGARYVVMPLKSN